MSRFITTYTLKAMLDIISQPFMQRAIILGVMVALICAFLGVFVTLRKMSFFADAIAHSSLAGIALGLLIGIEPLLGALIFALIVAAVMAYLRFRGNFSYDTILGIFFPASFSVGIIIIGLLQGYRPELLSYLFGNILAITNRDLLLAVVVIPVVLLLMIWRYRSMVLALVDEDMARVQGIRILRTELVFVLSLAAVVVVSLKVLGIILVSALIVIPAASAKNVSRSFSDMIVFSLLFSVLSVLIGLAASYTLDVASGASIVLVSTVLFLLTFTYKKWVLS